MNENQGSWIQEEPDNEITNDETGGLSENGGTVMMLNISPRHGAGLLIPYSRIEKVTIAPDASELSLFGAGNLVVIKGSGLETIITAIQTASAWSLTEGQSPRNSAMIESINITLDSDH